jgi:hypothetical protein
MVRRSDGFARTVVRRSHLVQQQEGIDEVQSTRRERTANDEATALALAMSCDHAVDSAAHVLYLISISYDQAALRAAGALWTGFRIAPHFQQGRYFPVDTNLGHKVSPVKWLPSGK